MPSTNSNDRYWREYKTNDGVGPITAPLVRAAAVTPNDSTDLTWFPRELWVGSAGDLKVDFVDGGTGITIKSVPAGTRLAYRVSRIYATGTTAANILALD